MVMSKIITIAGQKGGTGKSVTAVNLSTSLALLEKNTLLIDCDPQGSSTEWSGIKKIDYNCDISTVLSGRAKLKDAIVKTEFNHLDILPSGFNLFQVSLKLSNKSGNDKLLRLLINEIKEEYQYIIIDTPSSYSFLSLSAICAADWLLACMTVQDSYVEDFYSLLKVVKYVRLTHKFPLKIAGILFNRCKTKDEIASFLENQNLSDIKQMVYDTFIPEDENIKKSTELKVPIALHDIKSPAASAYLTFAEELHSLF